MSDFVPQTMLVLERPEQIKCFTDALRIRVLRILRERAATNQQIADELGEPHAKVLYHVRFLLDAGLVTMVEQRITGGNVEKYYRAVARVFELRPVQADVETDVAVINSFLDTLRGDLISSATVYEEAVVHLHQSRGWLTPERATAFNDKLTALIAEYYGDPPPDTPHDPTALPMRLVTFSFREVQTRKGE
jgi:DNA-binding transcriptional ArsR family regulator